MIKNYRYISKTKKYKIVFIMPILIPKSGFLFRFFLNIHLIIYINKVQFGKLLSLAEIVKKIINQKKRILIFDCQIIKIAIINT